MGKFKDLTCLDTPPMPPLGSDQPMPEVYVFDLSEYELSGQILVTIYANRLSIAHRTRQSERWSAPRVARRLNT